MGVLGMNGLTAAEHQQIIRSEWAADGILSGCEVIHSSTDMSLTIQPGAAVLPTSGTGAIIGATPQTRIVLDAAPATGVDTYGIYARVNGASIEIFKVKNGAIPAGVKRLEQWIIPAGATTSSGGWPSRLKDYAVPTGAGQSHRADWVEQTTWGQSLNRAAHTAYRAELYLPQDREVEIRITQTVSAQKGGAAGAIQWTVTDSATGLLTAPVLLYDGWAGTNPLGSTRQFSHRVRLAMGGHTLTFGRQQIEGAQPICVGGQAPAAQGLVWRPFNRVEVIDQGIAY